MSQLINMAQESILLFSNIFTGKFDPTQLNDVQNWITKSKAVLKSHNTENTIEDRIIEKSTCDLPLTKEWISNGVWNVSCMKHFKSKFHFHIESNWITIYCNHNIIFLFNTSGLDFFCFLGFSEAQCIRYNNEKQLLSLYEAVQKLQRTEYLNTLIQTILRDVIPAIKSNIDPASAEYARAYKTMFILCQGLNPEVPVLVKTDS